MQQSQVFGALRHKRLQPKPKPGIPFPFQAAGQHRCGSRLQSALFMPAPCTRCSSRATLSSTHRLARFPLTKFCPVGSSAPKGEQGVCEKNNTLGNLLKSKTYLDARERICGRRPLALGVKVPDSFTLAQCACAYVKPSFPQVECPAMDMREGELSHAKPHDKIYS